MTRIVKFVAGVAIAAAAFVLPAQAEDKDVIDYRENIMKALDAQTAALGMIVSTQIPEDNLVQHTESIAIAARAALKSFEAKVPGGEAKPEVWSNWPDFEKRMKDFVEKTDKMAKAAKAGGGPSVVIEQMVDALTCKGCHDIYRQKK